MKSSISRQQQGFTLLEIMIVIGIIGIVIAIAMPAFLRSREVSFARACQENLAKIEGSIQLFATENKLQQADPVSFSDITNSDGTGYLKSQPKCPARGTYTITTVGVNPTCSIGDNPGAPFAPHLIEVPVPAN